VQDLGKARHAYAESADLGEIQAMRELGRYLENGLGGPRDIDQALIWYTKAMEKGDDQARSAYLRLTMPPPVVDDLDDLPVADPIEDPD
ncbi:MAG: sel1 repeat family protein, partial [Geothrix sp.]|nr:sel1 repeat family protein [Geothrix sp.]